MQARSAWRRVLPVLLTAMVMITVTACGSAAQKQAARDRAGAAEAPAPMPAQAPAAKPTMPAEPEAAVVYDQAAPAATGSGSGGGVSGGPAPQLGDPSVQRKLILNATVGLEVADARRAMGEIQRLANVYGGYVADSNLTGTEEQGWNAMVKLRLPITSFGEAYAELKKLGELRNERQYTQDVTEEFIDMEARLKVQKQWEATLLDLQSKANSFEEWERVTYRLNDVRIQIEQIEGRLRFLENQVAFSTIDISLYQPPPGIEIKPAGPKSLGQRMSEAFRDSARAVQEFAEALLVLVVALIPVLMFLVPVGLVIWLLARAALRRRPAARPPAAPPGE